MNRAFIVGIIVGAIAMRLFLVTTAAEVSHHTHAHDEVHVHADFLISLDGTTLDLTQDKYQSDPGAYQHAHIHLHDNQGNIIHRHADGVTFGDFMDSIGLQLTDECLTLDTGETYCTDEERQLVLFVNESPHPTPREYVIADNDQVLLYYGTLNAPELAAQLAAVTNEACIYSGTCPERGTPPAEGCGLTCEVSPEDLGY